MKLLLDTHIFLWLLTDDQRLPKKVRVAVPDRSNEVYLSVASFWEIIVKYQLGKLPLPQPPETYIPLKRREHRITDLPLNEACVAQLAKLSRIHGDPFDRMLICQAMEHGLTLATVDPIFHSYPVAIF